MKHDRQPVYDALNKLPDAVFAALCMSMSGTNTVMAVCFLDDPTPAQELTQAMQPFVEALVPRS